MSETAGIEQETASPVPLWEGQVAVFANPDGALVMRFRRDDEQNFIGIPSDLTPLALQMWPKFLGQTITKGFVMEMLVGMMESLPAPFALLGRRRIKAMERDIAEAEQVAANGNG
jgi:hypothetical protein